MHILDSQDRFKCIVIDEDTDSISIVFRRIFHWREYIESITTSHIVKKRINFDFGYEVSVK